ncbi:MAG: flagellar biosynthesis protein FlhB [Planctomycetota bacterium]
MAEQQDQDQRTENATPQRLNKARQEGQVAFSPEFVSGLMLTAGVLLFWMFGLVFFGVFGETISVRLTIFEPMIVDPRQTITALIGDVVRVGLVVLGFILAIAMVATGCGLLQTNFNFSLKPLELKFNKLDPNAGIKRIFSSRSVVRGALSIFKATILLLIVYLVARSRIEQIAVASFGSYHELMLQMSGILLHAAFAVAGMMAIVGIVDFAYQRWKHAQDMKMSLRDIKDENKESEGDPLVRARVRRIQAEMGRKRMLADVPKASVVITNPTHFAVALQYDRENMSAPVVIAKGADHLARKIIEIAEENGVAVVQRKPVARFLYSNVEIGNPIPFELYQVVAEILNFVQRMRSAA